MMNSGSSVGHGSAGEGGCSHRPLDLTSTPARVPQNAIMTSDYAPLDPWYLAGPKKDGTDEGIGGSSFSDWFTSLGKYFLLIYGLIPISLYVSMALVRNATRYFMLNDVSMYDAEADEPCLVRSMELMDELGQAIECNGCNGCNSWSRQSSVTDGTGVTVVTAGAGNRAAVALTNSQCDRHRHRHRHRHWHRNSERGSQHDRHGRPRTPSHIFAHLLTSSHIFAHLLRAGLAHLLGQDGHAHLQPHGLPPLHRRRQALRRR